VKFTSGILSGYLQEIVEGGNYGSCTIQDV